MKILIFVFVVISLYQFGVISVKAQDFDPVYDVADVMADLLSKAPNRPLYRSAKKRIAFAGDIVTAAHIYDNPELLIAVKVFNESSFKIDAVDATNQTYGLGQMHGVSTEWCDTKTRKGQLNCMSRWLNICRKKCKKNNRDGEWFETLSCYGTSGHCNYKKAAHPKKYKNSINRQLRMWKKYEQQREIVRKGSSNLKQNETQ